MPTLESLWVAAVNGLWQSSLVILAAGIVLRVLRVRLPVTRCTVWSLSALSVVPLTLLALTTPAGHPLFSCAARASAGAAAPALAAGSLPSLRVGEALLLWPLGALAWLMWLALGGLRLQWLRRRARPVTTPGVLKAFADLQRGRARCALLAHPRLRSPVVLGVCRPAIIVPQPLLTSLSIADLRLVLAHELAHVARYDAVTNLLERVVGALFWVGPLNAWALHRARQAREEACDDWVIALTGDRRRYAKCLLNVAAGVQRTPGIQTAPALLRNPTLTVRRIESMLHNAHQAVCRLPVASSRAIALAALLLLPAVSRSRLVSVYASTETTVRPTPAAPSAALVHARALATALPTKSAPTAPTVVTVARASSSEPIPAALQPRRPASAGRAAPTVTRRVLPKDVPPDHWAADAVAELCELGLLQGYPPKGSPQADGKRRPMGLLSEMEIAKYLPADVPPDHWAAEAVAYLYKLGLLEGYPSKKTNRPVAKETATRRPLPFKDMPLE